MYSPPRCEERLQGVNRVRPRPRWFVFLLLLWTTRRLRRRRLVMTVNFIL